MSRNLGGKNTFLWLASFVLTGLVLVQFLFLSGSWENDEEKNSQDPRGKQATSSESADYIGGRWSDACPCEIPCPCWKIGQSKIKTCLNIQVYWIESGVLRNEKVGETLFVVVSRPVRDYLAPSPMIIYVGERASQEVTNAFSSLLRKLHGDPFTLRTERVQIHYKLQNDEHQITIPGVLDYKIHATHENRALTLSNEVRAHMYSWLSEPRQGITRRVKYEGMDGPVSFTGTNALFARFHLPFGDRSRDRPSR